MQDNQFVKFKQLTQIDCIRVSKAWHYAKSWVAGLENAKSGFQVYVVT